MPRILLISENGIWAEAEDGADVLSDYGLLIPAETGTDLWCPRHRKESDYILGLGYGYLYHQQNHLDQTARKLTAETCGMKRKTI